MKEEIKTFKKKRYYRARELSEYIGCGLSTIWYWNAKGLISSKKLSSKVTVFDINEVEKALFGGE